MKIILLTLGTILCTGLMADCDSCTKQNRTPPIIEIAEDITGYVSQLESRPYFPYHSEATQSELTKLMEKIKCREGGNRIRKYFSTHNNSLNENLVVGPFSKGAIGGTIEKEFIGVDEFSGDIMVISRLTNEMRLTKRYEGHNIALYICPVTNHFSKKQILGANTAIDNFTDYNQGISIGPNSGCAAGNIDLARPGITSSGFFDGQSYIDTLFGPYCK